MKDISIGIYHKDHQYGKRLMEYLNHQKDFPMTASFTSDEEMFFKQEQEGDFECLVLRKAGTFFSGSHSCLCNSFILSESLLIHFYVKNILKVGKSGCKFFVNNLPAVFD